MIEQAPAIEPNRADFTTPPVWFLLEVVIEGVTYKAPVKQFNKESIASLMEITTALYMPRISGWNLYDEKGNLLISCPISAFLNDFVQQTPLKDNPADPKKAGWRALPLVTATSQEFQDMIQKAKNDGKVPT